MTCAICRRMVAGFGYGRHRFDSMRCMNIYVEKERLMTDFTASEEEAMQKGGAAGGEYLASIGQFGLDKLTAEQAKTFLHCMFGAYHEALVEAEAKRFPV